MRSHPPVAATIATTIATTIAATLAATIASLALIPPAVHAQAGASRSDRAGGESSGARAPAVAEAIRVTELVRLDGRNDDAAWRTAAKYSGFRTFEPRVDTDPAFATEFQAAYDDRNLYVFVRMFDPHPDSIMRALSRRDVRGPSDQIKLLIDSYDDKRSGYEFAVNPDGVKRDYSMANDQDEDESWDGIWEVATVIDSLGWTAEFRIPLSQMRYANANEHTFGFGIWRDIERLKERSAWPLWSPRVRGISSQLGRLTGMRGLSTARRIEATPYLVSKNRRDPATAVDRLQEFTVGADLKVGLTPNITLDATVNPDFGQVEADPAVVNLTNFETFFSERRPFFVEGSGFYQFALNCYIVVDCQTNEGLFYSRRIGRSPSLSGLYGNASTPTATPIAAAMKLTGRTAGGLSFGVLDAMTQQVGGVGGQTVEPRTNYAVVRANQDLRDGQMGFSLIGTAVNRSLDALTDPYLHQSAYAAGATFRNKFNAGNYEVAAQLAASLVQGTSAAILATQQSPQHYYQMPGDELTVDPTATSLSGFAGQLKVGKYGGGVTRFESSVVHQSAGFEVNDLGFLNRSDLTNWSTWAALSDQEAKWIYRWAQLNGNYWMSFNTSGVQWDHGLNVNGHMGLTNNWDVHLGGNLANFGAVSSDRATRGGPLIGLSPNASMWGGVNSDRRKRISGGMWVNAGKGDEGKSGYWGLDPYLNFRPSTRTTLGVGFGYSESANDDQWYGNYTDIGGTHYSFARIEQTTVNMNTRLNYTATRDLSFEFYVAPFVSHWTYSDVRELSNDPESPDYDARFVPYVAPLGARPLTSKVLDLRGNAVIRWEYRPGSTLFVVWQHGKSDFTNSFSDQSWTKDFGDLFDLRPDNTFVVKVAYWLNR